MSRCTLFRRQVPRLARLEPSSDDVSNLEPVCIARRDPGAQPRAGIVGAPVGGPRLRRVGACGSSAPLHAASWCSRAAREQSMPADLVVRGQPARLGRALFLRVLDARRSNARACARGAFAWSATDGATVSAARATAAVLCRVARRLAGRPWLLVESVRRRKGVLARSAVAHARVREPTSLANPERARSP